MNVLAILLIWLGIFVLSLWYTYQLDKIDRDEDDWL